MLKELGTRLVASEALVNAVKQEMRKEGGLLNALGLGAAGRAA